MRFGKECLSFQDTIFTNAEIKNVPVSFGQVFLAGDVASGTGFNGYIMENGGSFIDLQVD